MIRTGRCPTNGRGSGSKNRNDDSGRLVCPGGHGDRCCGCVGLVGFDGSVDEGTMPEKVKEYRSGKKALIGLFAGQVKKLSNGKAPMPLVNKILEIFLY